VHMSEASNRRAKCETVGIIGSQLSYRCGIHLCFRL